MNWPLRWDLLTRYRLIEIIVQWEGRLTTNHLCNSFGIGRQQASKDINCYIREIAPGNIEYDKHLKGYKPTPAFLPKLTTGTADEYLHVISRNKDISHTFDSLDLGFANTEMLHSPIRHIQPEILRTLVRAARENKRVEISYVSLRNPEPEYRVIAPHTLVCTPLRWHVRAYCEMRKDYRDFVLSRFRGEPEIMDESQNKADKDKSWNTNTTLCLVPDQRLSESQKQIIAQDYGMEDGRLEIKTRGPLVRYTLQAFNIDPTKLEPKPEAQQLVIENLSELQPYLF